MSDSVKLKFTPHGRLQAYCGRFYAKPGDVVEVSRQEAERLVEAFPENFSIVEEARPSMAPSSNTAQPPSKTAAEEEPPKKKKRK
ncbi:hypothetical protein GF420_11545 [candidate division GN15 bacterium]|nr:hypothetical protein [candidate division GN15 bacterium]